MTKNNQTMLVLDDEEAICFALSEYFRAQGYRVDCAQQVEEARGLLLSGCYAVLITDLRLAGSNNLDGLEVVRLVHEQCPATRIVVLTAYGTAESEAAARKRGVHAFLRKPKPLADVAQVVIGLIGNALLVEHS